MKRRVEKLVDKQWDKIWDLEKAAYEIKTGPSVDIFFLKVESNLRLLFIFILCQMFRIKTGGSNV